mgnify:FL=1
MYAILSSFYSFYLESNKVKENLISASSDETEQVLQTKFSLEIHVPYSTALATRGTTYTILQPAKANHIVIYIVFN